MPSVNHVQRELDNAAAMAELLRKRHYADEITASMATRILDALVRADRALSLIGLELDGLREEHRHRYRRGTEP